MRIDTGVAWLTMGEVCFIIGHLLHCDPVKFQISMDGVFYLVTGLISCTMFPGHWFVAYAMHAYLLLLRIHI